MAGLWSGLAATLCRLESLAADAYRLDEDTVEPLRLLQYRLHWSIEALAGVEPPPGAREGHEELADALADARESTGDVAEAIEQGGPAAARALVFEWRGALFRVRLARMRLAQPSAAVEATDGEFPAAAAGATALTFLGVALFAAGALIALWPLWAAGLALIAGGVLSYRP
jgi:hypothetical protein